MYGAAVMTTVVVLVVLVFSTLQEKFEARRDDLIRKLNGKKDTERTGR